MEGDCPFCDVPAGRVIWRGTHTIALKDEFPVSPGHSLIAPLRHICSWTEGTSDERTELLAAIDYVRARIDAEHAPGGYNIGINDGPVAGQTVPHLHMHLIPRYAGDVQDPRGGIRWVLPEKAKYWGECEE